jgi:hypothetical protein
MSTNKIWTLVRRMAWRRVVWWSFAAFGVGTLLINMLGTTTFLKLFADGTTAAFGVFGLLTETQTENARNRHIAMIGIIASFLISGMLTILDARDHEREITRLSRPLGDMELFELLEINPNLHWNDSDTFIRDFMAYAQHDLETNPKYAGNDISLRSAAQYTTRELPESLRQYPSWVSQVGDDSIAVYEQGKGSCKESDSDDEIKSSYIELEPVDISVADDSSIEWTYHSDISLSNRERHPWVELRRTRKLFLSQSSPKITSVEDIPHAVVLIGKARTDPRMEDADKGFTTSDPYKIKFISISFARGTSFSASPSAKVEENGLTDFGQMLNPPSYCTQFAK